MAKLRKTPDEGVCLKPLGGTSAVFLLFALTDYPILSSTQIRVIHTLVAGRIS